MRLLMCLAEHVGEVVSIDYLLEQVWAGVISHTGFRLSGHHLAATPPGRRPQAAHLHRDVPRLGYRLVASVNPWVDPPLNPPPAAERAMHRGSPWTLIAGGVAIAVILAFAFLAYGKFGGALRTPGAVSQAVPAQPSIAVLPFLDLTNRVDGPGIFCRRDDRGTHRPAQRGPGPAGAAADILFLF